MLLLASAQATLLQAGGLLAAGALAIGVARARRRADHDTTRIDLTAQHAVHMVEIGGRRYLIGTGPGSAPRLLDRLEDSDTPGVCGGGADGN